MDTQEHVSPTGTQRRTKRDFWEREREQLVAALLQRIANASESIALRDLLAMKLPEVLKVVLRNHAKSLVRKEKPLVLQTHRRFELDDAEVREQFRALRDALAERIVLDLAELKPVLAFGIRLQFDLIVRPRGFLESLLYHHAAERERNDVLVILTGFNDEREFVVRLVERLRGYAEGVLTKEAFSALCRRVEREVYGARPIATLMADVRAYQNYCQMIHGHEAPSRVMDNQIILAMLSDRNLTELTERLLPEVAQKESWFVAELEGLLQQFATDAAEDVPLPAERLAPSEIDMSNFLEEAAGEIENELVKTSLRELRNEPPEETQPSPAKTETPQEAIRTEENLGALTAPEPVKKRPLIRFDDENPLIYRAKLEQQPVGPYPTMTKLIDEKSRRTFIRSIFQRDEDAYLDFIQRLELLQTWKEAKALLDGELNKRKVNPYSKEAIRLSDLIFSRYFVKR